MTSQTLSISIGLDRVLKKPRFAFCILFFRAPTVMSKLVAGVVALALGAESFSLPARGSTGLPDANEFRFGVGQQTKGFAPLGGTDSIRHEMGPEDYRIGRAPSAEVYRSEVDAFRYGVGRQEPVPLGGTGAWHAGGVSQRGMQGKGQGKVNHGDGGSPETQTLVLRAASDRAFESLCV